MSIWSCSNSNTNGPEDQRPQINVTQDITGNITWEGGNDYIITSSVEVTATSNLTIKPDVKIIFRKDGSETPKLTINGGLSAKANSNETQIIFEAEENTFNSNHVSINVSNGDLTCLFEGCVFRNLPTAILIYQSSFQIMNSTFDGCDIGMRLSKADHSRIESNIFQNSKSGIILELSGTISDTLNIFSNTFVNISDIGVDLQSCLVKIENNLFDTNISALFLHPDTDVYILNNTIKNCGKGVDTDGYYRKCYMSYNLIQNNGIGVTINGGVFTINNNNIVGNTQWHIYAYGPHESNPLNIDAISNWWGTTTISEIKGKLFDHEKNSQNYSYVSVEPIRTHELLKCGASI